MAFSAIQCRPMSSSTAKSTYVWNVPFRPERSARHISSYFTNLVVARVVQSTDAPTLQGFVEEQAAPTRRSTRTKPPPKKGMSNPHEAVNHSVGEYVREMAHTNGMESFWSMIKRGYIGTFHHFSAKHLQRYVTEFAGRHNMRDLDTLDQMAEIVDGMIDKRLKYRDLVG